MELEELIKGCSKGSDAARKHLYLQQGPIIKSVCLRYIKDSNEALDTFHDCFIKILHSIEKYNFNGSFDGWIKRLSVNYCLDILKKKNKLSYQKEYTDHLIQEEENEDELKGSAFLVNEAVKADFSKADWNAMIAQLPEHYRITFCLFQLDNYSHAEIAKELNIEEKTSRSRLSKAKKRLRVIIEESIKQKINIG
jgi:RNA polymerase sigma factor (sigma-70 family)